MRKNLDYQDGWHHPNSHITKKSTSDDRLIYTGSYFFRGIEYRFTCRQQKSGPVFLRGRISPISPADGRILQMAGREKKNRLNALSAKNPDTNPNANCQRISELNICTEFYPTSTNILDIKAHIQKAVLRIYEKHAAYLHRIQGEIARPSTISPGVAAHKYTDKYLAVNHPNLSAKSCKEYRHIITSTCAALPAIPMCKYHATTIKDFINKTNLSLKAQDLVRKFWTFCLDSKLCEGKNPFPPKLKKKASIDYALRSALRPETLSLQEEDRLFELLLASPSGANCGIALQLWGGYSAKTACNFTWGDIIWSNDESYVRVRYFRPDLAGATHDFTAPLFTAGALILSARYQQLRMNYTERQLSKLPIVSQIRNPQQALSAGALTQHATTMLRTVGLSYTNIEALRQANPSTAVSKRILLNTYTYNVNMRCALQSEPGTAAFLLHQSLSGNTTDDHYTSFTDEEAGRHLHALMSAVQPLRPIARPSSCVLLENGLEKIQLYAETARQRVGYVGQLILQPGEELVIEAPHGFTGTLRTRAFKEDGTLKRKTSSSASSFKP